MKIQEVCKSLHSQSQSFILLMFKTPQVSLVMLDKNLNLDSTYCLMSVQLSVDQNVQNCKAEQKIVTLTVTLTFSYCGSMNYHKHYVTSFQPANRAYCRQSQKNRVCMTCVPMTHKSMVYKRQLMIHCLQISQENCNNQTSNWAVLTCLLLLLHVWKKWAGKIFQFFCQLQSIVYSILNRAFIETVLQQLQHVCHFCQPAFLQLYI